MVAVAAVVACAGQRAVAVSDIAERELAGSPSPIPQLGSERPRALAEPVLGEQGTPQPAVTGRFLDRCRKNDRSGMGLIGSAVVVDHCDEPYWKC